MNKRVSVIIATYKRCHLLKYALEALEKQTNQDFEILVVLCPSNDGTEQLLHKYAKTLKIRTLLRNTPLPVTDAWNKGLENSRSEIIAFLDDDAVPEPRWLERHVQSYNRPDVGGVAGDVIPAVLLDNQVILSQLSSSEIIPESTNSQIDSKPWNRPLLGLEQYSVYLTRSGHIHNRLVATRRLTQKVVSAYGANMSFSSKALKTFQFPSDWMPAYACEALMGWHLWKNGISMVFNPEAKVFHIMHGSTLGRGKGKHKALLTAEYELFFYRLYKNERNLSLLCKFLSIAATATNLREGSVLKGLFYGNLRGLSWYFSNRVGGSINPLHGLYSLFDEKQLLQSNPANI